MRVPESKLEVIKDYINKVLEHMESEIGRIEGIKDMLFCSECGVVDPNYKNRCMCRDCARKFDSLIK